MCPNYVTTPSLYQPVGKRRDQRRRKCWSVSVVKTLIAPFVVGDEVQFPANATEFYGNSRFTMIGIRLREKGFKATHNRNRFGFITEPM